MKYIFSTLLLLTSTYSFASEFQKCNEPLVMNHFFKKTCIINKEIIQTTGLEAGTVYLVTNTETSYKWMNGNDLTLEVAAPYELSKQYTYQDFSHNIVIDILKQKDINTEQLVIHSYLSNAQCSEKACLMLNFIAEIPRGDLSYEGTAQVEIFFNAQTEQFSSQVFQLESFIKL